jgi:hypothetical protein
MYKIARIILLFVTNLFCLYSIAQTNANVQQEFQLTIQPTKGPIKLDGILDEPAWNSVEAVSQFNKKFPNDIGAPKKQTEVKYLYDEKN